MEFLLIPFQFLLWTFWLHTFHLMAHEFSFLWFFHQDHHKQVSSGTVGFSWKNLFLYFDTWKSTADQWFLEVIPTIAFALLFHAYWLLAFYYVWAAFIQEAIRHNPRFNAMPFLTSGQYHLIHHSHPDRNFGVFTWWWDWIGGTYQKE